MELSAEKILFRSKGLEMNEYNDERYCTSWYSTARVVGDAMKWCTSSNMQVNCLHTTIEVKKWEIVETQVFGVYENENVPATR